jgi:hypothetical protein
MTEVLTVSTATPSREAALRLAESAIAAGLAAGGQVIGPLRPGGHGLREVVPAPGQSIDARVHPHPQGALALSSISPRWRVGLRAMGAKLAALAPRMAPPWGT